MHERSKRNRRGGPSRRTVVVAVVVAAFGLAGCSSSASRSASTNGTNGPGDNAGNNAVLARACQADLEVSTNTLLMFPKLPETGPTASAASVDIARGLFQATVEQPLGEFTENVPREIKREAEILAAGFRQFGRTADDTVLGSDRFEEAGAVVDRYLFDNCRQTKYTVIATDHRYDGLPETLPAGGFRLRLDNKGRENHEIIVLARAEGVDQSWDALLRLPADEFSARTRLVGVDDADPRRQGYASGILGPGEYLVACFVPKGTPSGAGEPGKGAPHHELGMRQIVTVK